MAPYLVGVSLGSAATGAEIVGILERARVERGAAPFVLSHDNGLAYCSAEVVQWCAEYGVVELVNEPRTPQHNAACERGIGELKAECGLGSGRELAGLEDRVWVGDVDEEQYPAWCVEVRRARDRLDRGRLRGSRGYETAEQLDRRCGRRSLGRAVRASTKRPAPRSRTLCATRKVRVLDGVRRGRRSTERSSGLEWSLEPEAACPSAPLLVQVFRDHHIRERYKERWPCRPASLQTHQGGTAYMYNARWAFMPCASWV